MLNIGPAAAAGCYHQYGDGGDVDCMLLLLRGALPAPPWRMKDGIDGPFRDKLASDGDKAPAGTNIPPAPAHLSHGQSVLQPPCPW